MSEKKYCPDCDSKVSINHTCGSNRPFCQECGMILTTDNYVKRWIGNVKEVTNQ